MSKFNVAFDSGQRHAVILNGDDENVPAGHEIVGSFEADIDTETGRLTGNGNLQSENGDHIFVAEAKKVLSELEDGAVTDFSNVVIEDKASNQPRPDETVQSIKEVEQQNASALRGTEETGEDPEITRAGKPAEDADADAKGTKTK